MDDAERAAEEVFVFLDRDPSLSGIGPAVQAVQEGGFQSIASRMVRTWRQHRMVTFAFGELAQPSRCQIKAGFRNS